VNDHHDRAAHLVAAIAVRLPGRTVSFAKAARLAYLADREAMRRHGFPVLDDQRRVTTAGGGALCIDVLQAMREGSNPEIPATGERTPGVRLFSTMADMKCTIDDAVRDEDLDLFSRAEIDVIDDVVDRWGGFDLGCIDSLMSDTTSSRNSMASGRGWKSRISRCFPPWGTRIRRLPRSAWKTTGASTACSSPCGRPDPH
jgi:hypothetical protein